MCAAGAICEELGGFKEQAREGQAGGVSDGQGLSKWLDTVWGGEGDIEMHLSNSDFLSLLMKHLIEIIN